MEKAAITPNLVSELVRTQFPQWAHLPVRTVELDGWDNTTFRLGDNLSVRLPSADGYTAQVEKEQRWLPVLAPRLPLPVPTPVAKGLPGCGFPRPWSVYGWLDGVDATLDRVSDLEQFAIELADFLTALYPIDPAVSRRRTFSSPTGVWLESSTSGARQSAIPPATSLSPGRSWWGRAAPPFEPTSLSTTRRGRAGADGRSGRP